MEAIQYHQFNYSPETLLKDSRAYILLGEMSMNVFGQTLSLASETEFPIDKLISLLESSNYKENQGVCVFLVDIQSFSKFYKTFSSTAWRESHLSNSIFLWNASKLNIQEMNMLIESGAADDFFDQEDDLVQINTKIQFLLKYKQLSNAPKFLNQESVEMVKSNFGLTYGLKRMSDIFLSTFLLLMLIPLFILVAIAIKLESRGPVFYISNRVGRYYKVFPMIKFRSMKVGADRELTDVGHLNMYGIERGGTSFFKIKDDPRVSGVGKFLRKTSIDEFPQLINVLMGHMSIVGNRPLPLYEAEKLLVNKYIKRFDAPAGITGLWQVVKKRFPDMNEEERIALDIQYASGYNFFRDFSILIKTPGALLQNQNY